jgi:hypothetical protein
MSDEGPYGDGFRQPERTFVNDVEVSTRAHRRIAMTIANPVWTVADVSAFIDFAKASGATGDDRIFFGTFRAEVSRNPLAEQVTHQPPADGQ